MLRSQNGERTVKGKIGRPDPKSLLIITIISKLSRVGCDAGALRFLNAE
jgi:hypothetical protein